MTIAGYTLRRHEFHIWRRWQRVVHGRRAMLALGFRLDLFKNAFDYLTMLLPQVVVAPMYPRFLIFYSCFVTPLEC